MGVAVAAALGGCGSDGGASYTGSQIKAAYYKPADETVAARPLVEGYWPDPGDHQHTNYVPLAGIETCPQAQRANENAVLAGNSVRPQAGDPVNQFVLAPKNPDDNHTPSITQGALVFG